MKTVITIGREAGSGGREIGEKLAAYYKIPYFDKELLSRAAKESGFCEEMIQMHDEKATNSFLYNLVMDTYSFGYNSSTFVDMPISHKVFLAQFDTVKKIADEGPCVIVVMRLENMEAGKSALEKNNITILTEEDIKNL